MGIIEDIKGRIEHLSEAEHAELRAWFVERDHQLWDEQIARDRAAGKFAFEPAACPVLVAGAIRKRAIAPYKIAANLAAP